jgi:chromosome segregation ATPase
MKTLSALRETLLPLSETISTRLARVYALEESETAPLLDSISKTNKTVVELQARVDETHTKLVAIPLQRNQTTQAKDNAARQVSVAKGDRQRMTESTTAQIKSLETKLAEVRSDQQIVSGLLLWIQQQGGEWIPDAAALAQLKNKLKSLQTETLMQETWSTDSSKGVTGYLKKLSDSLHTAETQLTEAIATSTATLANEQSRLDVLIASEERKFNEAAAQLSELDMEFNTLNEALGRYSLSLSEAQTALATAQADLDAVHHSWQGEKDQLKAMKDNLQTILLLLPHSA